LVVGLHNGAGAAGDRDADRAGPIPRGFAPPPVLHSLTASAPRIPELGASLADAFTPTPTSEDEP
jgi:hypothetical protein